MKWIRRMLNRRRGTTEGQKRADEFLSEVKKDGLEIRKLTHSLRNETNVVNHLGARLKLAMEVRRNDT